MKDALIALAAFALQTLSVFAFNSRLFGLLKPGSGFYTNVEMAMSYTSLVTPARWAFAIWGIIYTWESVALTYLFLASDVPGWNLRLWLLANAFQAIWAPLFSTERLAASTVALAGIAVSLVSLGASLRCASGLAYGLIAAPIWLHAGWACAASIVNLNLTFAAFGTPAATQLAVAFASAAISGGLGVGIVSQVVSAESTALAFAPLPLAGALCWALAAVRAEREPAGARNRQPAIASSQPFDMRPRLIRGQCALPTSSRTTRPTQQSARSAATPSRWCSAPARQASRSPASCWWPSGCFKLRGCSSLS
uniref:Uncharacterized protein n=1 Tax=Haptolina brevifila TaxID=156173 RepID=A0A7S2NTE6_9EUKA